MSVESSSSVAIIYIFIVTITVIQATPVHQVNGVKYATLITCEGQTANITCDPGTHINVIRANFGRFSISICNEQGDPAMQVNCISMTSLRVLHELCEMKNECHVDATTGQFGDSCPGSTKYLEVHYQCKRDAKKSKYQPHEPSPLYPSSSPKASGNVNKKGSPKVHIDPPFQVISHKPTTSTSTTLAPITGDSESKSTSRNINENKLTDKTITIKESFDNRNNINYDKPFDPSMFSLSGPVFTYSTTPGSSSVLNSSDTLHPPPPPPPPPPLYDDDDDDDLISNNVQSVNRDRSPLLNNIDQHSNGSASLCPPVHSRGLFWNWTRSGMLSRQRCPARDEGWAEWICSIDSVTGTAYWLKPEADLSGCRSHWLITLENRFREKELLSITASALVNGTQNKPLYGGDLGPIVDIIDQLIAKVETGISDYPDIKEYEIVEDNLKYIADICSNLVDDIHRDAWYDLPPTKRTESAAALINQFERITLILMEIRSFPGDHWAESNNLYVSIHFRRWMYFKGGLRFPGNGSNKSTNNNKLLSSGSLDMVTGNTLYLPEISLSDFERRNMVRIAIVVYGKVGHLLDPPMSPPYGSSSSKSISSSSAENDENEDKKGNSNEIVNGNDSDQQSTIVATIVNSDVISVLVVKESSSMILLREPIEITFRHLIIENITNARCVFWDTSQWSEFGCITVTSNATHTSCRCNHLTNFAVLVDYTRHHITEFNGLILHGLTRIGCIVSSFCLCICLVTFIVFRNLRSERTFIHTNLCLCLLTVQLIFILGIDQVQLGTFCSIIAASLHYSLLASFLWMLMEAIHLYYMLIEVCEPSSSRLPVYFITAYILPLTIIGLTLGLSRSPYGPSNDNLSTLSTICWLESTVILQSFILPISLILASNFVFLIIAQCAMCKHITTSFVHKEVKHQDRIKRIRLWARGSLALLFLLGLTWSFGIIYVTFPGVVTAYLFTGFNVLQGVFIFIFTCLTNEKVRREYVRVASRCSWLSWLCCQLCSTWDGEKVTSPSVLDRTTFFHPGHHHSASLIQAAAASLSTSSTTTTGKPSSSGSSAGCTGQGIPLSACYPETEEPMISSGSSQLLSGRKTMTTLEDGSSRIYDHTNEIDVDPEMETRALMEGLTHSDATSGPMRPIIMRGDVSLTRIPGEHLYECIPEESAYRHANNLLNSSTSAHYQQHGSNYLQHNHSYHQYHQPLSSSTFHQHHHQQQQQFNPHSNHPTPVPHHLNYQHQTLHHQQQQQPADYQQLHFIVNNKQPVHLTGKPGRTNVTRDNNRYNLTNSGTLERRSTLQRSGLLNNHGGSSDELLPAIIRDNTRSPYGTSKLTSNQHAIQEMKFTQSLSASPSASSSSSEPSSTSNLPQLKPSSSSSSTATTTTQALRLNIPVSPRSPKRTSTSSTKKSHSNRKPKTVFAKLKGNQIVSTTGTVNSDSC